MEKSPTSPVANAIWNGDKQSCSHTPGEGPGPGGGGRTGENWSFAGLESLGSQPDFSPSGYLHFLAAWSIGRVNGVA